MKNNLDDYDNSHWDGVDKVMLKVTILWAIGWGGLAIIFLLLDM